MKNERPLGHRTAETVRIFAESKLARPVPDTTVMAWISLSRTMRVTDDLIDSERDEAKRRDIYRKGIDFLTGETEELGLSNDLLISEMTVLKLHFNRLKEGQKKLFTRNLKNLLEIGEMIRNADDSSDLGRLSMVEGQLTSHLFASFLPENFYQMEGYGNFLRYFKRLGRAANAYDSLVDLSEDYRQNRTRVKPTLRNMAAFTRTTLGTNLFLLSGTKPSLIKVFFGGAVTVAKDRTGNSDIHFSPQR